MSRIKNKDTGPERAVRKLLSPLYRGYRLHRKDLPGKPDIVLPRYNTVIFVHGCYWHRHKGCKEATTPKSNMKFWLKKFETNVENDKKNIKLLKDMGWNVEVIWACETRDENKLKRRLLAIINNGNKK